MNTKNDVNAKLVSALFIFEAKERQMGSFEEGFFYLNLSILAGEYVVNFEEFKKINTQYTFDEISQDNLLQLRTEQSVSSKKRTPALSRLLKTKNKSKNTNFGKALTRYFDLANNINKNIDSYIHNKKEETPRRLRLDSEIEKIYNYYRDEDSFTLFEIDYFVFLLNLQLAELDEFLESSPTCLESLKKVKIYLNESSLRNRWTSPIIETLNDKCDF